MKKRFVSLAIALFLVLSLCACAAKPEQTPAPAPTPTPLNYAIEKLTIGTTAQIEKALPGEYDYDMLSSGLSQLPLVYQDAEGAYHPLLASFKTEDSLTWTYTVLDGMRWSDGTPVTAEDILFTLRHEDEGGSANLVSQTDSSGKTTAAKYTAFSLSEDLRSISLTLASANVRELSNMTSFRVLPKHIYEGKETLTDAEARVSCGPYVLQSFDLASGALTFRASGSYPEKPNAETIVCRLFDNEDTMYMALINGDIDLVWAYSSGVSGSYRDTLEASSAVSLLSAAASNAPAVLAFNCSSSPFENEDLRKAVSLALDYEALRLYAGGAGASVANRGFVPAATVGYKSTDKLVSDLAEAEKYMNAAGYTKNSAGLFVNAAGDPFSFTLTCRADKTAQVTCGELIKTALEKFGVSVKLETLDSASFNAKTSAKFSGGNITMEAAVMGFTSAGMGMLNGLGSIYVDGSHAVQGCCQVYDPDFTAIRDALASSLTPDEYAAAAGRMQDYYAEKTPLVALYWDNLTYAASSRLDDLTVDGVFGLNNANNWFSVTVK